MPAPFSCHRLVSAGKLRLYVSNNDRQVRVFDLPSMRQVDTICCPAPVNYSSLSPNGDLLACVGDSDETHFYRAGPSGDSPHPVFFPHINGELVTVNAGHAMSLTGLQQIAHPVSTSYNYQTGGA